MAWHAVSSANDMPAVTLHLYSPPIREGVMAYDAKDARLVETTPGFSTIKGELVAGKVLDT